jgi:hypothetical protein
MVHNTLHPDPDKPDEGYAREGIVKLRVYFDPIYDGDEFVPMWAIDGVDAQGDYTEEVAVYPTWREAIEQGMPVFAAMLRHRGMCA